MADTDELLRVAIRTEERLVALTDRFDAHEVSAAERARVATVATEEAKKRTEEVRDELKADVRAVSRRLRRIEKVAGAVSAIGATIAGIFKMKGGQT